MRVHGDRRLRETVRRAGTRFHTRHLPARDVTTRFTTYDIGALHTSKDDGLSIKLSILLIHLQLLSDY